MVVTEITSTCIFVRPPPPMQHALLFHHTPCSQLRLNRTISHAMAACFLVRFRELTCPAGTSFFQKPICACCCHGPQEGPRSRSTLRLSRGTFLAAGSGTATTGCSGGTSSTARVCDSGSECSCSPCRSICSPPGRLHCTTSMQRDLACCSHSSMQEQLGVLRHLSRRSRAKRVFDRRKELASRLWHAALAWALLQAEALMLRRGKRCLRSEQLALTCHMFHGARLIWTSLFSWLL